MLLIVRHRFPWVVVLLVAVRPASAQSACSATATASALAQVRDVQHRLGSIAIKDMDDDVPASIQRDTTLLKQGLEKAVQSVLACEPTDEQPIALQHKLAQALKANAPEKPDALPPWGNDLHVIVEQSSEPQLLRVQLDYAIECGQDTILLVFAPEHGHWAERLLWQSPPYKDESEAFGDFFLDAVLPGDTPGAWRLAVAHGKPWCTSRFSGFDIDVLAPNPNDPHPRILWHTERSYSRGDVVTRLSSSGNTFELRLNATTLDVDGYERKVIYHYRLLGNTVQRIQPIASNARGFVAEWLSMPWSEAEDQILDRSRDTLRALHDRYEQDFKPSGNTTIAYTDGPVFACQLPHVFQVQLDAERDTSVPGKAGGDSATLPSTYFMLRETGDGYQLISAGAHPDPACHGPDLMPAN